MKHKILETAGLTKISNLNWLTEAPYISEEYTVTRHFYNACKNSVMVMGRDGIPLRFDGHRTKNRMTATFHEQLLSKELNFGSKLDIKPGLYVLDFYDCSALVNAEIENHFLATLRDDPEKDLPLPIFYRDYHTVCNLFEGTAHSIIRKREELANMELSRAFKLQDSRKYGSPAKYTLNGRNQITDNLRVKIYFIPEEEISTQDMVYDKTTDLSIARNPDNLRTYAQLENHVINHAYKAEDIDFDVLYHYCPEDIVDPSNPHYFVESFGGKARKLEPKEADPLHPKNTLTVTYKYYDEVSRTNKVHSEQINLNQAKKDIELFMAKYGIFDSVSSAVADTKKTLEVIKINNDYNVKEKVIDVKEKEIEYKKEEIKTKKETAQLKAVILAATEDAKNKRMHAETKIIEQENNIRMEDNRLRMAKINLDREKLKTDLEYELYKNQQEEIHNERMRRLKESRESSSLLKDILQIVTLGLSLFTAFKTFYS